MLAVLSELVVHILRDIFSNPTRDSSDYTLLSRDGTALFKAPSSRADGNEEEAPSQSTSWGSCF